ncbi:MAG TPA: type II toxin-antitoxin system Phd/YefM family antitoxin [Trueperaceae bacterium]|nr:type II toxin-antitoxin system Phd/YefM family antitoxin [Trueperaceae bacterium]
MERVIDVTQARRQFGTLLDEVYHKGDIVTIERKGKALAKIVPLDGYEGHVARNNSITAKQKKLLDELNGLPRIGLEQDPVEILRAIRKQKRINSSIEYGK